MRPTLLLAWRYLVHYRVRSFILILCIALVAFLPLAVELLVEHYSAALSERAQRTPLLIGAKGSRFDLLLNGLYFKGRLPDTISLAEVEKIADSGLALPVPLFLRHTARDYPVVGTSLDYFDFREIQVARGTLPLVLGDCVLGAQVARALELGPGDRLLSDSKKLYDLSATYPLKMRIAGVLAETGTADDLAVFVDVKTAWIMEGIGHGHQEVDETLDPKLVLERDGDSVTTNAAIYQYNEITPENIDSFHFHGGSETLPLTSVIAVPPDAKSATILGARYRNSKIALGILPSETLEELMDIVFQVKRFFDANLALVCLATALFLTLIILLTLRVRQREIETLFKIGCRKTMVVRLQVTELALVMAAGITLAGLLAWAAYEAVVASTLI